MTNVLAVQIKQLLDRPELKQATVAAALNVTASQVSKWRSGKLMPSEEKLAELANFLKVPVLPLLLLREIACLHAVAAANKRNPKLRKACRRITEILQASLDAEVSAGKVQALTEQTSWVHGGVTLADFPKIGSGKWSVITGDRREDPVKGKGDILGLSMAVTDVMFLHAIGLPPESDVRSDKTLLLAQNLSELLDTNLLIIGSPAVSLYTRAIMGMHGATFMFNIPEAKYAAENGLYDELPEYPSETVLQAKLDEWKEGGKMEGLLADFMKLGFVDPVDYHGIRGRAIKNHEDYGIVALSRNPWSPKHVAVICAGVHGGGTAGAVQLLSEPGKNFANRPWGGVLRVMVSGQIPWENRFEHLSPEWETHEYTDDIYCREMAKMLKRIKAAKDATYDDVVTGNAMCAKMMEVAEFLKSPATV